MLVLLMSLTACGPNCQSTCQRLYGEGAQTVNGEQLEDCGIQRAGRDANDLIGTCMDNCEGAIDEPGETGPYNPYERTGSSESVDLENERQAAVWMQCISETSCDRLTEGYCAPVW